MSEVATRPWWPPCVAPTWPEVVTDDWGNYWVRPDLESRAQEFVDMWDGESLRAVLVGRDPMVRDPDLYADEGLLVAAPGADEAVVYLRFEAMPPVEAREFLASTSTQTGGDDA